VLNMQGRQKGYRVMAVAGALLGLLAWAKALLLGIGALVLLPLGLVLGIGERNWYPSWPESLVGLLMHLLPGAVAAVLSLVALLGGGLLLWAARAAWRRAERA
jgi:hypothetical protein